MDELTTKLTQLNLDKLQLNIDKIDRTLTKLSTKASRVQSQIDNDTRVTRSSDYDRLDRIYQGQIQSYQTQNQYLREQQSLVDVNGEKYEELSKQILENENNISDTIQKIKENRNLRIQIKIDKKGYALDDLEKQANRLQSKLDMKGIFSENVKASDYKQLNKNAGKQIQNLQSQNQLLNLQKENVANGSKAWEEYKNKIEDNAASMQNLTKTIMDNAKAMVALNNARAESNVGKLDKRDEYDELRVENATSYKSKNKILDDEIARIPKRQVQYDKAARNNRQGFVSSRKALNGYKSTSNNYKLVDTIKKYTRAKKLIPESIIEKAAQYDPSLAATCADYNAYLTDLPVSEELAKTYKEQAKKDKREKFLQQAENLKDYYTRKQSNFDYKADQLNANMDVVEAQGYAISKKFYDGLLAGEKNTLKNTTTERDSLIKKLKEGLKTGEIKKGDSAYNQIVDDIKELDINAKNAEKSIADLNDQIRQLDWNNFTYLQDRIGRIPQENDFLIGELSRKNLSDDDIGGLTDEGKAVMTLNASTYETRTEQAKMYASKVKKYKAQLAKDPNNQKLLKLYQDAEDGWQSMIKSAGDAADAIKKNVEEMYQALQNKVSKLISDFTKVKDAEKDAFSYNKNIQEKTKAIGNLQKQLAAYAQDTSEETKAKVQQLSVQLEDAEKDLQETQYDKYLSDTKDMLSDFQDGLAKDIEDILNKFDVSDYLKTINKDSNSAFTTIEGLMKGLGYTSSDEFKAILSSANITKGTDAAISSVKEKNEEMLEKANTLVEHVKSIKELLEGKSSNNKKENTSSKINSAQRTMQDKENAYNKAKALAEQTGKKSDSLKANKAYNEFLDAKRDYDLLVEKQKQSTKNQTTKNVSSMLKLFGIDINKLKGYKTGSRKIPYNQLAFLAEEGSELQFDKSKGVLRQVGAGDKIFTNEMSENLWKLAQMNPSAMMGNINIEPITLPTSSTGNVTVNFGDLTLPDVTNSQEFASTVVGVMQSAIKNDVKTQKMMQSVTIDKVIPGHNSLSVRKF